jgi:hypothetical protein
MISLPRGDDAVLGETESRLSDRKLKSPFKPALAWSAIGVILGWLEAHEGQAAYASDSEHFRFAPRTCRPP